MYYSSKYAPLIRENRGEGSTVFNIISDPYLAFPKATTTPVQTKLDHVDTSKVSKTWTLSSPSGPRWSGPRATLFPKDSNAYIYIFKNIYVPARRVSKERKPEDYLVALALLGTV